MRRSLHDDRGLHTLILGALAECLMCDRPPLLQASKRCAAGNQARPRNPCGCMRGSLPDNRGFHNLIFGALAEVLMCGRLPLMHRPASVAPRATRTGQETRSHMTSELDLRLSGNRIQCTNALMLLITVMLCSYLHFQKGFDSRFFVCPLLCTGEQALRRGKSGQAKKPAWEAGDPAPFYAYTPHPKP